MDTLPRKRTWRPIATAALLVFLVPAKASGGAGDLVTLVSFARVNGATPYAGLLRTPEGDLYGTTAEGGTNGLPFGLGTIFKVSSDGMLTTLVSFNGTNGAKPYAGLALGPDGQLYGTTWQGGSSNAGTVFRVTTNGVLTSLLSFTNGNGSKPSGQLIYGSGGYFYGTTQFGGASNAGTVFRLSTNGVLTTLLSFAETNGANPYAELVEGADGYLYGTTVNGGTSDAGTVFRLTTNGLLSVLRAFVGPDGADPYGGLVQSSTGELFGTTAYGGANGYGTIFKITTNGGFTTLYSFAGAEDGANPWASLLLGTDGSLYGTTILGGAISGVPRGTVFQILTNGTFASLIAFDFNTNGISPYASLVQDEAGNLFGTTYTGGSGLKGTVFRLTPGAPVLSASMTSPNQFTVGWDAWIGKQYQLQQQTNLNQTVWLDFGPAFVASNSPVEVPIIPVGPSRFYRGQLILPP